MMRHGGLGQGEVVGGWPARLKGRGASREGSSGEQGRRSYGVGSAWGGRGKGRWAEAGGKGDGGRKVRVAGEAEGSRRMEHEGAGYSRK